MTTVWVIQSRGWLLGDYQVAVSNTSQSADRKAAEYTNRLLELSGHKHRVTAEDWQSGVRDVRRWLRDAGELHAKAHVSVMNTELIEDSA
jgi:hypothetical protein